jgi:hypothetical protein
MGETKTTPGPWKVRRVEYSRGLDASLEIVAGEQLICQTVMREIVAEAGLLAADEAHAELIARAVNAHDDLVAALKAAAPFLSPGVSRGPAIGEWVCAFDLVKAALSKAGAPLQREESR